jgi:hypothetical protein
MKEGAEVPERMRNFRGRADTSRRPGGTAPEQRDVRGGGVRGYAPRVNPSPEPPEPQGSTGISEDLIRLLISQRMLNPTPDAELVLDVSTLRKLVDVLRAQLEQLQRAGLENDPMLHINLREVMERIKKQSETLSPAHGADEASSQAASADALNIADTNPPDENIPE